MLVANSSGRVAAASPAAAGLFGLPPGPQAGLRLRQVFPCHPVPTDFPPGGVGCRAIAIGIGRDSLPVTVRMRRSRGAYLLFVEDARGHEAAAREARKNAAILTNAADAMTEPVWVRSADGRFAARNSAAQALFALPGAGDVLEGDDMAFLSGEKKTEVRAMEIVGSGGPRRYRITRWAVQDATGCALATIAHAADETEAVRDAAEQAVARRAAERESVERIRMFTSAGHDLRQPIQAISLNVHLLRGLPPGARTEVAISRIERSLVSMMELVENMFDAGRLDLGGVVPKLATVPIADVLTRLETLEPLAAAKGLSFRVERSDADVETDPAMLDRILGNLVQNAIRYTDAGSVRVSCSPDGEGVRIDVSDTGIGIPEDHISMIWDDFYRVDQTSRSGGRGAGLGLAIARRLTRLLGHTLSVESEPDRGSVFSVRIGPATNRPGNLAA